MHILLIRHTIVLGLASILMACATTYPMGLSEAQWQALSPDQQASYQAEQYRLDEARRARLAAEREAEKVRQAALATEMQQRVEARYQQAVYGDIVTVVLQGGTLNYGKKAYAYEPLSFNLVRGESKRVVLRTVGRNQFEHELDVRLADDGNTLYLDEQSRERVVLVNRRWEHGESYRVSQSNKKYAYGLQNANVFMKYKTLGNEPTRIIIDRR